MMTISSLREWQTVCLAITWTLSEVIDSVFIWVGALIPFSVVSAGFNVASRYAKYY